MHDAAFSPRKTHRASTPWTVFIVPQLPHQVSYPRWPALAHGLLPSARRRSGAFPRSCMSSHTISPIICAAFRRNSTLTTHTSANIPVPIQKSLMLPLPAWPCPTRQDIQSQTQNLVLSLRAALVLDV